MAGAARSRRRWWRIGVWVSGGARSRESIQVILPEGGLVISQGLGLTSVPLAAAALAALALLAALLTTSLGSIPAAEPLLD